MGLYFDKLSGPRVTAVLNVLGEAPFFYRDDDDELFGFLRRNRAEFARFYQELFGWELTVDGRTARLYKERWHNPALRPSQHDVFDLTRRGDCLAFLLLLEYHGRLLEQENLGADDGALPRFLFGELFAFARARLAEELGGAAPNDEELRRILRGLWPALERYRFVRAVPRDGEGGGAGGDSEDHVLYEALPALHHYDLRRLGPQALARAFGANEDADTAGGVEGGGGLDDERAAGGDGRGDGAEPERELFEEREGGGPPAPGARAGQQGRADGRNGVIEKRREDDERRPSSHEGRRGRRARTREEQGR